MPEPYFPLLAKRCLLGGAEETTSGTMPNITGPLASTAVYDATIEPQNWYADTIRTPYGLYDGTVRSPAGLRAGVLRFWTEYRHNDQCLPMLTACGFKLAGGTYSFTTDISLRKTWGFKLQEIGHDGSTAKARVLGLAGCAGNVSIEIIAGSRLIFRWEFSGVWQTVTDVTGASIWSQAPVSSLPFVCKNLTYTIGGVAAPHTSRVIIDAGNTVSPRESIAAEAGISHYFIESRRPTVTLDPEARLVSQNDQYGLLLSSTEQAMNIQIGDGTNTIMFSAPKAQRTQVGAEVRSNRWVDSLTLNLNASSGDDELTITAT